VYVKPGVQFTSTIIVLLQYSKQIVNTKAVSQLESG
jgi:hypothetical protein